MHRIPLYIVVITKNGQSGNKVLLKKIHYNSAYKCVLDYDQYYKKYTSNIQIAFKALNLHNIIFSKKSSILDSFFYARNHAELVVIKAIPTNLWEEKLKAR
jgi:hypothetical protein